MSEETPKRGRGRPRKNELVEKSKGWNDEDHIGEVNTIGLCVSRGVGGGAAGGLRGRRRPPSPFPSLNCEVAARPRQLRAAALQFREGKGEVKNKSSKNSTN